MERHELMGMLGTLKLAGIARTATTSSPRDANASVPSRTCSVNCSRPRSPTRRCALSAISLALPGYPSPRS